MKQEELQGMLLETIAPIDSRNDETINVLTTDPKDKASTKAHQILSFDSHQTTETSNQLS